MNISMEHQNPFELFRLRLFKANFFPLPLLWWRNSGSVCHTYPPGLEARQGTWVALLMYFSSFFQIINYSTKMFAKSKFDEAKYLTLGVGAVNVAFTIVAVSVGRPSFMPVLCAKQCVTQDKSHHVNSLKHFFALSFSWWREPVAGSCF